jgi:hypothetical protein
VRVCVCVCVCMCVYVFVCVCVCVGEELSTGARYQGGDLMVMVMANVYDSG